jgi:hypothetical protein
MRRKSRVSQRAPERERADRKPYLLRREGHLAFFASPHADDPGLLGG